MASRLSMPGRSTRTDSDLATHQPREGLPQRLSFRFVAGGDRLLLLMENKPRAAVVNSFVWPKWATRGKAAALAKTSRPARVHRHRRPGHDRSHAQRQDVLRLLHRLPRLFQREPREGAGGTGQRRTKANDQPTRIPMTNAVELYHSLVIGCLVIGTLHSTAAP